MLFSLCQTVCLSPDSYHLITKSYDIINDLKRIGNDLLASYTCQCPNNIVISHTSITSTSPRLSSKSFNSNILLKKNYFLDIIIGTIKLLIKFFFLKVSFRPGDDDTSAVKASASKRSGCCFNCAALLRLGAASALSNEGNRTF